MGSSEPLGNPTDFTQSNMTTGGVTAKAAVFASTPMGSAAGAASFGPGPGTGACSGSHATKAPEETTPLGKRRWPLTKYEVAIMDGLTRAVQMVAEAVKAPVVVHKNEVPSVDARFWI